MRGLLPHPWLSMFLLITWLLLANTFSLGSLILGAIFGLLVPLITEPYWPDRPVLKKPFAFMIYVVIVIWDILVANFVVAVKVLFRSNASLQPRWVTVPLELRTPEAITILAGTITLTPGTLTADLSCEGSALLIHCLDAPDPDGVRDEIKTRYERRLKEIFE